MNQYNRTQYSEGVKIGQCIYMNELTPHSRPNGEKYRRALFLCHCGNEFEAIIDNVKRGNTISCGCAAKANAFTHGLRKHPLRGTWYQMMNRCYNSDHASYENYGGRDIRVYDKWGDMKIYVDYVLSLPNAMGDGLTVDRIDTNIGYYPGNLRWADAHTQASNKTMQSNNTSGYVGVSKSGKLWYSYININKIRFNIGAFVDKTDAAKARNKFITKNNLFEYPIQEICQ